MEGTTEPIVVVIGNPIAGNPAQFALERSLRAMGLDWRVLSFDVSSEDVGAALGGFAVTGIVGVLIDRDLTSQAGDWYSLITETPTAKVDCLWRGEETRFIGGDLKQLWLQLQIEKFNDRRRLWIGDTTSEMTIHSDQYETRQSDDAAIPDLVTESSVIVLNLTKDSSKELELDEWPKNNGTTLIVNLKSTSETIGKIRQLGYLVIGEDEFQIGTLLQCILHWTGEYPSEDTLIDAIEEYLSV
jgi:hypothetical protein